MNLRTARHATAPAALAVALTLVLTACGDDSEPAGDSPAATETTDDTATDDTSTDDTSGDDDGDAGTPDPAATPEDLTAAALAAIATAEKEADGTAYAIDDPDRDATWEVDVAVSGRTVEVEVDIAGTKVVGTTEDDLDRDDRQALADAKVSISEAIERTMAQADGTFDDAELDEDDNRYRWSVSVERAPRDSIDYLVDLQTGKVTQERDDDNDDNNDDNNDD